MKTAIIQLFCPSSSFKKCRVEYEVATSGRGYLYEILSVHEVIRKDNVWPVDKILQFNDHKAIDHQIACATQNEFSKAELGIDMTKNKPANKPKSVIRHKPETDDQNLPL